MNLNDFDYQLPESYIAQIPASPRDSSRLMVLNRRNGDIKHRIFREITEELEAGDVLLLNNTRVIPARLYAVKADTGGKVEILLLRQLDDKHWRVLIRGKRINEGKKLNLFDSNIEGIVKEMLDGGERVVQFSQPINTHLSEIGDMPLPPYIRQSLDNTERYQTIYSKYDGSAAAPTAGLHFTADLLTSLREIGVKLAFCTLHVGLDTFQPVKEHSITNHPIHSEWAMLSPSDAKIINDAKLSGGRVIAVGTTSARTLETSAILSAGGDPAKPQASEDRCPWRPVIAFEQDTRLFIYPGYKWRVLDGLITNFHLPKTTLLMMVSSLAGRENILNAYEVAKAEQYRFYSFGDAMFIR